MKNKQQKLSAIFLALILIISSGFSGCASLGTDGNGDTLKQSEEALLNGVSRAICYSGFREGQHPDRGDGAVNPSYEETLEDLTILSRDSYFKMIRLYDCDENSQMVIKVIDENNLDIQVMLGAWLKAEISNHEKCWWLNEPIPDEVLKENKAANLAQIETAIKLAKKYPSIISSVAVGNEALVEWNDHMVEVDTVIRYVNYVKSKIEQPVTVADNFNWWAKNGLALSKAVDFVSIHSYPLWEGRDIDTALAFTLGNIQEVRDSLPGTQIVMTEVGWATVASEFGERASEEKQEKYYNQIMDWADEMNYTIFFFEAYDEPWKGNPDNAMGAEKHWGIFNVDRTPKKVMGEIYPDLMK